MEFDASCGAMRGKLTCSVVLTVISLSLGILCALLSFLWPSISVDHRTLGLLFSVIFLIGAVVPAWDHYRKFGWSVCVSQIEEPYQPKTMQAAAAAPDSDRDRAEVIAKYMAFEDSVVFVGTTLSQGIVCALLSILSPGVSWEYRAFGVQLSGIFLIYRFVELEHSTPQNLIEVRAEEEKKEVRKGGMARRKDDYNGCSNKDWGQRGSFREEEEEGFGTGFQGSRMGFDPGYGFGQQGSFGQRW
ncbi:hypothetical protein OsJ_16495 [Oryza sativa Japonica Group]|uniref:Uncharacterized protein n=1 Tax=Oryza sativa subsp. japonica TaxID=39947 RepID=B9FCY7_ORYSJ|nr:hypothetical protein OsJ_16495 [Oryza sativa Japonica Group]